MIRYVLNEEAVTEMDREECREFLSQAIWTATRFLEILENSGKMVTALDGRRLIQETALGFFDSNYIENERSSPRTEPDIDSEY